MIAAWQIVRGHYEARGQLDDGDGGKEPEAFVILMVMKIRESAQGAWRVVRTWFGDADNAPVHRGELEMVERCVLYI